MKLPNGWRFVGVWLHGPHGERLRAISGGGGGKGPSVSGNPTQTVVQSGDPSLAEMNQYVTAQLKETLPKYGGLTGLTSPQPYMKMDFGQSGGPERQALGGIESYLRGPASNPYELAGLGTMAQAADPTRMLAAGSDYFNQIAAPSIVNQLTAAGQGRSGAIGESLASGATQMALPILQKTQDLQSQYGGTLANYGGTLYNRELANLTDLLSIAGQGRMEEANAQQAGRNTLLGMMSRFPVNSGAGTSQSSQWIPSARGPEAPVWQQVMSGLQSVAGIAAMFMCWVALALYGPESPEFWSAFYQANYAPHGRFGRVWRGLYRRYGQRLAKSRVALFLLRPIFNRVARLGARNLGVDLS